MKASGSIDWIASISPVLSSILFILFVPSDWFPFFPFPTMEWIGNIGQLLWEQFDTWHKPCASLAHVALCRLAFLFVCTVSHTHFYYGSISSWQRLAESHSPSPLILWEPRGVCLRGVDSVRRLAGLHWTQCCFLGRLYLVFEGPALILFSSVWL